MHDSPSTQTKANILIVDDTPANLRFLASTLSQQGYKVRCVTNGRMALTAAQTTPPDLVLLDIRMPRMDGIALLGEIQQIHRLDGVDERRQAHKPTRTAPAPRFRAAAPRPWPALAALRRGLGGTEIAGSVTNHAFLRKLLAHKKQVARLWQGIGRQGMTLVPLVMYFNHRGLVKMKIGIAKGKKNHDKRATEAKRDWQRQKARLLRDRG